MSVPKTINDIVDMSDDGALALLLYKERTLNEQKLALEKEIAALRAEVTERIGDHNGIKVGDTVVTYMPTHRWRESELRREYPELTDQYVREVTVEKFDVDSFASQWPKLAVEFQVRTWKVH